MSQKAYEHVGNFGEYGFNVERFPDGLEWEFDHAPLCAASDLSGVDAVAVEGLRQCVVTLRRWADELDDVQAKLTAKAEQG